MIMTMTQKQNNNKQRIQIEPSHDSNNRETPVNWCCGVRMYDRNAEDFQRPNV